tara:strand:+ start:1066 stop:1752 length:687 start_codon:yes stop_codon:yes gene_type:complete
MYSRSGHLAFVDFLFILLLAFISMFILALLLINPIPKKSEIERKAEYIVTLEWDDKSTDDIDIWIEDPVKNLLSFRNRAAGLMHLDKDDLGQINDIIFLPDGTRQVIELNREVVTFRGWIKGEYIVNVHAYKKRSGNDIPIKITLLRINPYKLLWEENILLTHHGQELTVRRFTLNLKGDMIKTNTIEKLFINTTRLQGEFEPREPSDRQRNLNLDSGGRLIEPRGAP